MVIFSSLNFARPPRIIYDFVCILYVYRSGRSEILATGVDLTNETPTRNIVCARRLLGKEGLRPATAGCFLCVCV